MIQMQHKRHIGFFRSGFGHLTEIAPPGVLARPVGDLQDHRGTLVPGGLQNALHGFHIVDVERAYGETARKGFRKYVTRSGKRHLTYPLFKRFRIASKNMRRSMPNGAQAPPGGTIIPQGNRPYCKTVARRVFPRRRCTQKNAQERGRMFPKRRDTLQPKLATTVTEKPDGHTRRRA